MNIARFLGVVVVASMMGLLTGCALPITAKVTNFNDWPADAQGSTFSFAPSDGKQSDLEQATYENYVGVELQRRGLRLAPQGQKGRFLVDVSTVEATREKKVLEPVYNNQLVWVAPYRAYGSPYPVANGPVYVPPYGYANGSPGVYGGYYAPDQFGSRYIGDREVTRTVQVSRLKVRLFDSASTTPKPRAVFESTAVYEGDIEDLPDTVPFLAAAMFEGFPGQNGRVRVVKFDNPAGGSRR